MRTSKHLPTVEQRLDWLDEELAHVRGLVMMGANRLEAKRIAVEKVGRANELAVGWSAALIRLMKK